MFPLRDDNPQFNTPYAVYLILALNVFCWLVLQGAGFGEALPQSVCNYGLVPASLQGDYSHSACTNNLGWAGLLTSMFMHGGWMHIIGNMWFLWVFGGNVEDSMGSVRFAIFYVLCGLFAAAAQVSAGPNSGVPMVGASGAIGGIMGGYIMLFPRVKVQMGIILIVIFTTFRIPAVVMLGYWIAVQVIGGISSSGSGGGVAFWAHVGGFGAGAALVWIFKDEELLLNHPFHGWRQQAKAADIWNDPSNRQ